MNGYLEPLRGGALDAEAPSKPKPFYPLDARAAGSAGAVVVWVLVDDAGHVFSARALAGHPRLRIEAAHAACLARFRPTPLRPRGGPLTYRFAP